VGIDDDDAVAGCDRVGARHRFGLDGGDGGYNGGGLV
jgi:hypothetical protein